MRPIKIPLLVSFALLVVLGLMLGGSRGRGAPTGPGASAGQKTDNFILVIDQSNEMNVLYGPKAKLKSTIAREIAEGFVAAVPINIPVKGALYMYGVVAADPDHTVVRVIKMQGFNRSIFSDAIKTKVSGQAGLSNLSAALRMIKSDLSGVPGRTAVIVISGGNRTDSGKPSQEAAELKKAYGANLCIYTILVGDSQEGGRFLKGLVDDGKCGLAVNADEIGEEKTMRRFANSVFFKVGTL